MGPPTAERHARRDAAAMLTTAGGRERAPFLPPSARALVHALLEPPSALARRAVVPLTVDGSLESDGGHCAGRSDTVRASLRLCADRRAVDRQPLQPGGAPPRGQIAVLEYLAQPRQPAGVAQYLMAELMDD